MNALWNYCPTCGRAALPKKPDQEKPPLLGVSEAVQRPDHAGGRWRKKSPSLGVGEVHQTLVDAGGSLTGGKSNAGSLFSVLVKKGYGEKSVRDAIRLALSSNKIQESGYGKRIVYSVSRLSAELQTGLMAYRGESYFPPVGGEYVCDDWSRGREVAKKEKSPSLGVGEVHQTLVEAGGSLKGGRDTKGSLFDALRAKGHSFHNIKNAIRLALLSNKIKESGYGKTITYSISGLESDSGSIWI
jgi:hypothetical protein